MKSIFVIFILFNIALMISADDAIYCVVKEKNNAKIKAGEHLVYPDDCQIITCDDEGQYTIVTSDYAFKKSHKKDYLVASSTTFMSEKVNKEELN